MQVFANCLSGMFYQPSQNGKSEADFKFSAPKIAEMLNIKPKGQPPLEGSFFLNSWNQQSLVTFSEDDIMSALMEYVNHLKDLSHGDSYKYTKVLTQKQVFVTFPLVMGMPFMFDYNEPTAIIYQSQLEANFTTVLTTKTDMKFTYARNLDGSVGFMDTLGDVYASTGIINKLQFYIPLTHKATSNIDDNKLTIEFPEQDANLIHMSVWPYTTLQKTDSLLTVIENPLTKLIKRPAKVMESEWRLDRLAGIAFEFQGYSYSTDYQKAFTILGADLLTNVRNLLYQKDVALTEFNFRYLAKEPQNKEAAFTIFYGELLISYIFIEA